MNEIPRIPSYFFNPLQLWQLQRRYTASIAELLFRMYVISAQTGLRTGETLKKAVPMTPNESIMVARRSFGLEQLPDTIEREEE